MKIQLAWKNKGGLDNFNMVTFYVTVLHFLWIIMYRVYN